MNISMKYVPEPGGGGLTETDLVFSGYTREPLRKTPNFIKIFLMLAPSYI